MKNLFLYVVVFLAGAAVLALELLGTRILGPFYGVSLFLLTCPHERVHPLS